MKRPSRRGRGSVTIQNVAREAGVSAMTVSRVINGERNVRESTRAAVLEAISRLNYSPNTAARSLAAGDATHIGLLYANPSAAYLSQFLVGALDAARRAGCHIVLEACESERADEQAEATRRFAASGVDGVILPPPLSESIPVHAELAAAGTPVVTVAMGLPQPGGLNVRIHDREAAAAMTRYLVSLGHRAIGFIAGHPNNTASGERQNGFLAALEDAGLDPARAPIEQGYFTYRSGLIAAQRLLARDPRPTAIFASNDDMAAAVINVAHRAGLEVPGDLSVVGFDDTAPATTVWPELTTVRQPIAPMAAAAVDMLLADLRARRAGEEPEGAEHVLDHSVVIRESAAAPRKVAASADRRGRGTALSPAGA
ncbi:LacI family DNA-binding transcriptional regulator [Sphingosinicella sp. LHD-64]|uniref:LacI family DNA-binding transcriptional regulator n=1 Tax=Sphingosinicella sp. LHD-64 TaxID=3072139 RepID=UPI00280C40E7|nr:LacI family DNA-binding transcriptional regulator [Sphingosinicella sp. LHD-64]MDQ8758097.1 LacI family DNA-binding transcriptional regulator [Sphingosinicella sp. LHD-64]